MDSFFARNRLSAYLDGALPPAEAREVAAAIARDPELAEEYEALRRAVTLLQQEGPTTAPPGFHARVMGRVADEGRPTGVLVQLRRVFNRVPVEAVALAAAAAVVVIAIQFRPGETPATDEAGEARTAAAAPAPPAPAKDAAPEPKDAPPVAKKEAPAEAEGAPDPAPPAPEMPAVADAAPATQDGERRKTALYRSPKVAEAATEAYVPEWEDSQRTEVAAVRGLQLTVGNAQVLYQLDQLARRAQGQLRNGSGQPTSAFELSAEAPSAAVLLVVPADRSAEVEAQLRSFGAKAGGAPSGLMVGNGNAGFYVDVRYTP